jgi:hypothetical protein
MKDLEEYETHDIYLAAYLKVCGCTYKMRRQGTRVFFMFTNPAGSVRDLRDAYYQGSSKVAPHQFAQEIIAMKQLVNG